MLCLSQLPQLGLQASNFAVKLFGPPFEGDSVLAAVYGGTCGHGTVMMVASIVRRPIPGNRGVSLPLRASGHATCPSTIIVWVLVDRVDVVLNLRLPDVG